MSLNYILVASMAWGVESLHSLYRSLQQNHVTSSLTVIVMKKIPITCKRKDKQKIRVRENKKKLLKIYI
jgi:hypothetical protein